MTSLIDVLHVSYSYGSRPVVRDVSLSFKQGEIVSLLGPNGSGKTTLLKLLLGILEPQTGTVSFDDRPLQAYPRHELARQLAYVPQVHHEAFAYAVEDVVLMGRMPYHSFFSAYSLKDREIVERAMARLNILHLKDRPYTEISGGERQLALIARSLSQGANVFVMDEPVNGLDYGNQMRLLNDISGLAREGLTFIMTTHFPDHALMMADRVVLFKKGAIVADGPPIHAITRDTLFALYQIDVDIVSIADGRRVCLPTWAQSSPA